MSTTTHRGLGPLSYMVHSCTIPLIVWAHTSQVVGSISAMWWGLCLHHRYGQIPSIRSLREQTCQMAHSECVNCNGLVFPPAGGFGKLMHQLSHLWVRPSRPLMFGYMKRKCLFLINNSTARAIRPASDWCHFYQKMEVFKVIVCCIYGKSNFKSIFLVIENLLSFTTQGHFNLQFNSPRY